MIDLSKLEICRQPEIDPAKIVQEPNLSNVGILIQSILCGEAPTGEETPDQWRQRIETYAAELMREIYS